MMLAVIDFAAYMPFAAAAILAALSLIALAYMLGSLLSNDQLRAWSRMELTEAFYSVVIIALAALIFTLADGGIGSFLNYSLYHYASSGEATPICDHLEGFAEYSGLPCHVKIAKSFFSTVFGQSSYFLYSLLRQYSRFSFLSSMSISGDSIVPAVGNISFAPFAAYLHIPMAMYSYMFDFGIKSLILLKLQEILLEFIDKSVFPVFFLLGAVLRAFPAMRRLGGLLMAAGVSLYYVYPAFYVLGAFVITGMMQADADGYVMDAPIVDFTFTSGGETFDLNGILREPEAVVNPDGSVSLVGDAPALTGNANLCVPPSERPEGFSAGGEWAEFLSLMGKLIAWPFSGFAWGAQFDDWILGENGIVNGVARMVFFSLFFSFISIMSTVAAIKSLSPLFGGDVEIAGLTHLV
ncbi:MAG: hypothetical protein AB1657_01215 [Candidatus Micrarchaeota archaeon]